MGARPHRARQAEPNFREKSSAADHPSMAVVCLPSATTILGASVVAKSLGGVRRKRASQARCAPRRTFLKVRFGSPWFAKATATLASTNKSLAQSNKSRTGLEATKPISRRAVLMHIQRVLQRLPVDLNQDGFRRAG
jgi:hypothetical protein